MRGAGLPSACLFGLGPRKAGSDGLETCGAGGLRDLCRSSSEGRPSVPAKGSNSQIFPDFPIFLTFLGDFNLQKLPSRRLQTLWEWKSRVLLEEYYIFNVVLPLEVE